MKDSVPLNFMTILFISIDSIKHINCRSNLSVLNKYEWGIKMYVMIRLTKPLPKFPDAEMEPTLSP